MGVKGKAPIVLSTSRVRILVGPDEETRGRAEESLKRRRFGLPLSPDKGSKEINHRDTLSICQPSNLSTLARF
jgi:hypothetical protein